MIPKSYTTEQVARMLDVPARSVYRWIVTGLVRPHLVPGRGGETAVWSDRDVREARIVARLLRQYGVNAETTARVMEQVRESGATEGEDPRPIYLELLMPGTDELVPPPAVTMKPRDPAQTTLPLRVAMAS